MFWNQLSEISGNCYNHFSRNSVKRNRQDQDCDGLLNRRLIEVLQ